MASHFRHLQGGYTEYGGPASFKNGRASNVASIVTHRSIDSSPIPIGVSLKRKRGGANLNDRFDRMMDSVNMVSRSSTHPTSVSKRRKRMPTLEASSSDPPAPQTPRTIGRDFSTIKLQGDGASSMLLEEDISDVTTIASMPSWLTHTLSGLQPQHPLRRLLPSLNKPHPLGPRSPPAAPADETPFAFLRPDSSASQVVPPIDSGGHGSMEDQLYAPSFLASDLQIQDDSAADGIYTSRSENPDFYHPQNPPPVPVTGAYYQPSPHLRPERPVEDSNVISRDFAVDYPPYPPARLNSPNISLVDSYLDETAKEPGPTFTDTATDPGTRPFYAHALAPGYGQRNSNAPHTEAHAASYSFQSPPVTPAVERGGTLALPQDPPILLEDDEDVFAFSSSPGRRLPPAVAQSPPLSLPLPPSSHRFETPTPIQGAQLVPPSRASRYVRRESSLSIASFISPSLDLEHSPPPVDLSQLDFRWTPGPTFRPQRAPLTSPPAPLYRNASDLANEETFELLDAPINHEQSTSDEPTSSPSSNDLAAHVRRLQRMLQSSSEAGSPTRHTASGGISTVMGEGRAEAADGEDWEVVTPRRYAAGPSSAPGPPHARHHAAPSALTPEPPTPAFAPAPGIYISPLRGTTDADDDEDMSQVEMENVGRDELHVEPVEEYEPSQRSRGSEHDSIESWSA